MEEDRAEEDLVEEDRAEEDGVWVLHLSTTSSPSATGRAGLSKITGPSGTAETVQRQGQWPEQGQLHRSDLPETVMWTARLLPPAGPHQYRPESDG